MTSTDTSIGSQQDTICPVCGDFKLPHDQYCRDCEDWKDKSDNRRKAEARRRKFGGYL